MKSLLLLFAALALSLSGRAQMHYIGSGSVMMPRFKHAELIMVWPSPYSELKAGDIVAYRFGGELIASRLVSLDAGGWITRALGNERDYPGHMTDELYLGVASIDLYSEKVTHSPADIAMRDLYILTPYVGMRYSDAIRPGLWESPYVTPFVPLVSLDPLTPEPPTFDPPTFDPPVTPEPPRVPEGAVFMPLALVLAGLVARRR
jgi:hypothetical protein